MAPTPSAASGATSEVGLTCRDVAPTPEDAAGIGREAGSAGAAPVVLPSVTGDDATGGEETGGELTEGEVTGGEVTGGDVTGGAVTGGDVAGGAADEELVREGVEPAVTDDEVVFSLPPAVASGALSAAVGAISAVPAVSLQPESKVQATADATNMCGNFSMNVNSFRHASAKGSTLAPELSPNDSSGARDTRMAARRFLELGNPAFFCQTWRTEDR